MKSSGLGSDAVRWSTLNDAFGYLTDMAGEKPAARLTDLHLCPLSTGPVPHVGGPVTGPGAPTVLIGGLPAARVGDMLTCVGPPDTIVQGSSSVFIGGQPAARMGDMTIHGGTMVLGCFTVLIGNWSGGGDGVPAGLGAKIVSMLGTIVATVKSTTAAILNRTTLSDVVNQVNPSGSVINCGNIIDAAAARLSGKNRAASAPAARDGSFPEIEQRFGTKLSWNSNFQSAFNAVRAGGNGTMAIVGISYSGGSGSHVVLMANDHDNVGIIEAQNWGPGNPPEVVSDAARANDRYNADGNSNVGWGIIPR